MEGEREPVIPVVHIDALGPMRARDESRELSLAVRRPNQVMAVLAASPNAEASAARLLDQVWDRDPDRQGMDLLKNAVYQVNRKFQSDLGVRPISSSGSDYRIDREAVVLDSVVFEEMVDRIDEYRSADPSLSYRWASEACSLWRSREPFPGFDDLPVVADYCHVLAAKLLVAEKARFDAALSLGRHDEVLAELEVTARENPFDEALHSSLMLALARGGRQRDALTAYEALRRRMIDASGVELSAELQELQMKILSRHDAVTWHPRGGVIPGELPINQPGPTAIPGSLAEMDQRPIAGRLTEADRLGAFVLGGDREPPLRVIVGKAGMGKSRLVAEVASRAADAGLQILYGRCSPDHSAALDPIGQLLQDDSDDAPEVTPADHRPSDPQLAIKSGLDPVAQLQRRTEDLAQSLVGRVGGQRSLVVLEDVHWIDPASLQAVDQILATANDSIAVVMTARSSGVSTEVEEPTPLAEWLSGRPWQAVELGPLNGDAVLELVHDILPGRHRHRARAIADLVQRNAQGIPMLVTEVLSAVEHETLKRGPFSFAHVEAAAPRTLQAAVRRRMLRLSREAREAVKAAAVGGSAFELNVLARVLGSGEDEAAALLDECISEDLLVESGGRLGSYQFAHELLRSSVLGEVGANHEARLHRRFATALDVLVGPAGVHDRALHLLGALRLGEASDAVEAVNVTLEAAQNSVQRFDVDQAIGLLHHALLLTQDLRLRDELIGDVQTALASVQSWGGEPGAAAETLYAAIDSARRADDPVRFARAVLATGPDRRVVFDSGSRFELLKESHAMLGESEPTALGISVEASLLGESFLPGRSTGILLDPVDLVRRAKEIGDPAATMDALFAAHSVAKVSPQILERVKISDQILDIAGSSDAYVQQLCGGLGCRLYDLINEGRFDAAERSADRLEEVATRYSMPRYQWRAMVVRSALMRLNNNFESADRLSTDALTIGQSFDRADAEIVFGMQMRETLRHTGSPAALVDPLRRAAQENSAVVVQLLLIHALVAEDSLHEAEQVWAEQRDSLLHLSPQELWLPTLALAAELVVTSIDDVEMAEHLHETLSPFSGQWVPSGVPVAIWGPVDTYLGALAARLGYTEEAEARFEAAESAAAGSDTWLGWTRALREAVLQAQAGS